MQGGILIIMNNWYGIIDSHTGETDALICEACFPKFPFPMGLTPIQDTMGCLDRKCALCGHAVADDMKEHRMKEAA
jgi:hypothetical protein